MSLEVASFIGSLVATNPISSDARAEGDDHLRLIKTALQGSFPTSTKAWYNPNYSAKTANYTVLSTDMSKTISFDATAGNVTPTLPSLAVGDAGWMVDILKIDSSVNTVIVTPASGTINGASTISLSLQWEWLSLVWTGTTWYARYGSQPFTSTDAGATELPIFDIFRNSASAAASDIIGGLVFSGRDSASNKQTYAQITSVITDPTSTSEDADIYLQTVIAGAMTTVLRSSGSQILIGGALGVTGAVDILGSFSVNTNKFTVDAATGNIVVAGSISGVHSSPTTQRFTAGSGTYTPTAGMKRIRVRMMGGGAGGGAAVTNAGTTGNDSSFENWTAKGGSGGTQGSGGGSATGGAGGTSGTDGTGTLVVRISGQSGDSTRGIADFCSGRGGSGPFAGGGRATAVTAAASTGVANTGGGGSGGSNGSAGVGAGGGAGEYVEFWMTAAQVGASRAYTVGATANGGTAGSIAGGAGAGGILIIEEFYW